MSEISIPKYVENALRKMNMHGFECFIVGGAVRSSLLNLPVHDFDMTTNALPEQTKEVFREYRTIDTGIRHGTVVVLTEEPLEITTYRKDAEYKDHRHPDQVEFTSALEEDCARRDFTVNALCYHPDTGILDFYGGVDDLKNKIIRCIRDPHQRFEEDALRILRALRFAARLSFSIEKETAKALHDCRDLLRFISVERLHEETDGLLIADGNEEFLLSYRDVFNVFIPEWKDIPLNLWKEIVQKMQNTEKDPAVRMAVLLSPLSRQAADSILKRMKYSNADAGKIRNLLDCSCSPISSRIDIRHLLHDLKCPYEEYLSFRCALDSSCDYENALSLFRLSENDCVQIRQLDVNGHDLMQAGFQGKEISDTLNALLNAVMEERTVNNREVLLAYIDVLRTE